MSRVQTARFAVRHAAGAEEIARAQGLRAAAFRGDPGACDADVFDARCRHVLIEDRASGQAVATFRILPLASGAELGASYAARHYDLSALSAYPGRMAELGRFCLHPAWHDPDILRLAWGAIAGFVDAEGVALLFGCSSFRGTDAGLYRDVFAVLTEGHIAPRCWRPKVKAPRVVRFVRRAAARQADRRAGLTAMPPLLRSYLAMGGWVSDHAVVDSDLNTLHVFTGLEIARIPPARARTLRLIAG